MSTNEKILQLENTLKKLATVHSLLNEGLFQGHGCRDVSDAIAFIEQTHRDLSVQYNKAKEALKAAEANNAEASEVIDVKTGDV